MCVSVCEVMTHVLGGEQHWLQQPRCWWNLNYVISYSVDCSQQGRFPWLCSPLPAPTSSHKMNGFTSAMLTAPQPVSTPLEFVLAAGKSRFPLLHGLDVPRGESRRKIPSSPTNSFSQFISSCHYCCCHIALLRTSPGSLTWLGECYLARKDVALEVGWASRERGLGLCCVISYFQINTKGKRLLTRMSWNAASEQVEWFR